MAHIEPRLRMPHIDGWSYKESFTIVGPHGEANIIASSEPIVPSLDAAEYAEAQGHLLLREGLEGYRELSFGPARVFGGRAGFMREFEWAPPDGVPIRQIQLYYAADARGYTATATAPAASFPGLEPRVRDTLARIQIAPDGGAPGA